MIETLNFASSTKKKKFRCTTTILPRCLQLSEIYVRSKGNMSNEVAKKIANWSEREGKKREQFP